MTTTATATATAEIHEEAAGVVLAELILAVATELANLAALTGSVQEALSRCQFSHLPDPETLAKLQDLDRVSQTLDSVGHLMKSLPAHLPPHLAVATAPLLSERRNRDLRRRMAKPGGMENGEPISRPGDVSWL